MNDTENKGEKDDSNAESSQNELSLEDKLILTRIDRFKKMVLSQQEWEAYLMEKLEKQERASGSSSSSKGLGFFERIKQFFKTPEESQFFIERETKEFINYEQQKIQEESSPEKKET